MTKRLIMILALAFVVGITFSAYAEVQNVKVSGDLLMRAINRSNFTLCDSDSDYKYKVGGLMSTVRVRVDADLTDNVVATVRLLNERSWGTNDLGLSGDMPPIIAAIYNGVIGGASDAVVIDLAYVTLKEFLYSPLTLTVGRQELRFGNGLVIGDVDTNLLAAEWQVPLDLSARKAFDAIRATLNYDPIIVDLVYAKIAEVAPWWMYLYGEPEKNDTDLYGVNIASDLKDLGITGKGELYYFGKINRLPVYDGDKKDTVNTIGMLVSGKIVDNLTGSLEFAYQFGKYTVDGDDDDRSAYALQAILGYNFQTNYAPNLSVSYTYLSGDKNTRDDKERYWDPMYEDQTPNNIVNALFPNTNVSCFNIMGSMKPKEDLILAANLGFYSLAQKLSGMSSVYFYDSLADKKDLGIALDLTATYDYTEDVQLGLTWGMFDPGEVFEDAGYDKMATQLIGSMKVTF